MAGKAYFRFKIDAYTPDTLPLSRFAEYVTDLAVLFGFKENVHFSKIGKSSAVPTVTVDRPAVPKVRWRLKQIQRGNPPEDAAKAYQSIDRRLAADNAIGEIRESRRKKTGVVIAFPGRERRTRETYGPFNQIGTIDGQLIRIGGELNMVPVHLRTEDDKVCICQISKGKAREIAPYIFGPTIRAQGEGRWERNEEGEWEMHRFTISDFKVLSDVPLSEAINDLRSVESKFKKIADPLVELKSLRQGSKRSPSLI